MKRSVIEQARKLIKRRKFGMAIRLLSSHSSSYRGSFEYYLALGTSYLYLDDDGNATQYYEAARKIHINSTELLLGQAAIFLRRGDNISAVEYYLDVLNMDPGNKAARGAIEFIRTDGRDFMNVQRMKSNGKIRRFYPQLGTNPDTIRNCVLGGILVLGIAAFLISVWPSEKVRWNGKRGDISNLAITPGEKREALSKDLTSNAVHYLMDNDTVVKSYENAAMYFEKERDNRAKLEINRILNSNATISIKKKAAVLESFLFQGGHEPTFDNLDDRDNYSYAEVEGDHILYNGCYVAWTGTIANPEELDDGSWKCVLFVGYHNGIHVEGTVDVVFRPQYRSPINPERPIKILGVVTEKSGKIVLDGRGVYQPVKGKFD